MSKILTPSYYVIILSFFLSISINGQNYLPKIINYGPKDYGSLLPPENWSLEQDSLGLIYVGNTNTILVFDGIVWDTISVPNALNISALKSENGVLYYGGSGDFGFLYSDEKGKLRVNSLRAEVDIPFATIWRINAIENLIYFQSYEAIFVYNTSNESVETILPQTSFHLSFKIEDELFVRERKRGLMSVKGLELELVSNDSISREYGLFDGFKDGKDDVFITQELGLLKLGSTQLIDENGTLDDGLKNVGIIGGVKFNDRLLLYSISDGVFITDLRGELISKITQNDGLPSNEVKKAMLDQQGNIWLATGNGIVQLLTNTPFSYYMEKSGVTGNVNDIEYFNDHHFIGTSQGLFIDNSEFHFENILTHQQVWSFEKIDSLSLFIATSQGLYLADQKFNFTQVFPYNVNELFYDKLNNILIAGGAQGIFILDGFSDWQVLQYYKCAPGTVTGIIQHPKSGDYWVGTSASGAIRVKFDGFEFSFDIYGDNDGLRQGVIIKPFWFDTTILFGTSQDLLRFVDEKELMAELSEAEKQNPDNIRGYFTDARLGGEIEHAYFQDVELAGDIIFQSVDNQISLMDLNSGEEYSKLFKTIEMGRINAIRLLDDRLFICSAEGLVKAELSDILKEIDQYSSLPFATIIKSVVVNDSINYSWNKKDIIPFPYRRNKIVFRFASGYVYGNKKPIFSYRLLGDDDTTWTDWKTDPTANFSNLHEGTYTLEVRASNNLDDQGAIARVKFTILSPWYRTIWAYITYVLLLVFIVYIAIRLGQKRLKDKNEWLESVVEERTAEIKEKNKELEHSYEEIAEQKQEITDSINYAKRIQEAILPVADEIKTHINDYFVLFMPKDIVSGDFYWFANIGDENIFVCADCTGHGVPGAFMSMIGSDKLNRVVLDEKNAIPATILSQLNKGIKTSLKQDESSELSSRDGMDAAIISINSASKSVQYAGANRPLFLIRDGELIEYKATKLAVGGFTPMNEEYQNNQVNVQKGDCLYMTSDGYPDQFGGENGKKFKLKQFKDLLVEIHALPMDEQKEVLRKTIIEWMGEENEQIDDICVIGVRL